MPDRDLEEKEKLEDQFEEIVAALFLIYLTRYRRAIISGSPIPSLDFLQEDFRYSLDRHYRRTQDIFRTRAFTNFDPVETNGPAQELFEKMMGEWRIKVAEERSILIAATNRIEAEDAFERANSALVDEGKPFSILELAALATLMLKRKFEQRKTLLAVMETQAAAESTKDLKADALDATPVLASAYLTFKKWNTRMDGRERPSHHNANSQERLSNEPFKVGGSDLKYPGDPAAPIRETARCRCYMSSYVVKL